MAGNLMETSADVVDRLGILLVVVPALVAGIAIFLEQAERSFWLAYRILAGTKWRFLTATWWVFDAARRHPFHAYSKKKLFQLVRKRVEFHIFWPRPQWRWPMQDDDELYRDYGKLDLRDLTGESAKTRRNKVWNQARARFGEAEDEWREALRKFRGEQVIKLYLAGELNDALSEVKLYFDTLKVMHPDPAEPLEFLVPVEVEIGFIASQHLLTGLLIRYNEKWGDIIDGFERDTSDVVELIGRAGRNDPPLATAALDFRQIQSFIYHCWLLWGPSIPVCEGTCQEWASQNVTLQYGYGDENNSIEIVGARDFLYPRLAALMGLPADADLLTAESKFGQVMAIPASVKGVLQYSSVAQMGQSVPSALAKSWRGSQDERPVLRLMERTAVDQDRRAGKSYEDYGELLPEIVPDGVSPSRSRYYSAYFWIMFVVLRRSGPSSTTGEDHDQWEPLHAGREDTDHSDAIWKAAIPFFEHGNMADEASCRFAKEQLADKALGGIVNLVEAWEARTGEGTFPLRFGYVCAIDDGNCSKGLAVAGLAGGESVTAIVRRRAGDGVNAKVAALMRRKIIDFDYPSPVVEKDKVTRENLHAACRLSADVGAHYARMDAYRRDAERRERERARP